MEQELLIDNDTYLKAGIHIGTKFKTADMARFIYKTRSDGLSVLDVSSVDDRLRTTANLLSNYKPEDILIACRRESGWAAVKKFAEVTGAQFYDGRYPPGILTNPELDNFVEAKVLVVCDPVPDKNAMKDAKIVGIPVVGLCDTNNKAGDLDLVVPCNNKGRKSLGLLFYLLAKEYTDMRDLIPRKDWDYEVEDFIEEE
jgi:small subunit ribosomal protein S2